MSLSTEGKKQSTVRVHLNIILYFYSVILKMKCERTEILELKRSDLFCDPNKPSHPSDVNV